jgi:hypothetical protein
MNNTVLNTKILSSDPPHEYFAQLQCACGAMDPNLKTVLDE